MSQVSPSLFSQKDLIQVDAFGLKYIWVAYGQYRESGKVFSVHPRRDAAIALALIASRFRTRGMEMRFFRLWLGLTRSELGALIGVSSSKINLSEADFRAPIPSDVDVTLRRLVAWRLKKPYAFVEPDWYGPTDRKLVMNWCPDFGQWTWRWSTKRLAQSSSNDE